MSGRQWTEPELLQALALYYQIPFGAIDQKNPAILALAAELTRSPGSIALKLANFASLDPSIIATGRRGMQNSSVEDRRIFGEYSRAWGSLENLLSPIVLGSIERRRLSSMSMEIRDKNFEIAPDAESTESISTILARRGQQFFRNAVLASYRDRCAVTDLTVRSLLRASHIIPWAQDASGRLDPSNGLCLNALHDAAFDRGLITLDSELRLMVSSRLRDEISEILWQDWFARYEGQRIQLPERLAPRPEAVAYHRERIFVS